MKKLVWVLVFAACVDVQGQSSGCYQIDTIPFAPDSFNVGVPLIIGGDAYSPIIPIGFNFCLYDSVYSQLVISSNDYLCFTIQYANGFSPWAIPSSIDLLFDAVLGPWQDLTPGLNNLYYFTSGTAPFRKFVVSYYDVPLFGCPTTHVTNQIILYETTNIIEIHTQSRPYISFSSQCNSHLYGLGNRSGTDDLFYENFPITNKSFRFIPLCASCVTSVNEIYQNQIINLFPNPATNEIKVQSLKFKVEAVEIYDVVGGKVYSLVDSRLLSVAQQLSTNHYQLTLNISNLPSGMYFVRIRTENGSVTKKLIKQ
ncbi:MAG TPA: T9SS type A sorting domain-containing protein [Bacteroidia bacterium]|nr:T9SS type A sorting domain-containing protein [Bacteroidia bacterium]